MPDNREIFEALDRLAKGKVDPKDLDVLRAAWTEGRISVEEGIAIGGNVSQSIIVSGDDNKVSVNVDLSADALRALLTKPAPSPTQPGDLPPGSYLPIQPNPFFTGRSEQTDELSALFATDKDVVINQRALVGMGGLGKTQLAVQFAWRFGYKFTGVHWVSAVQADAIDSSIALCGQSMGLDLPQDLHAQAEWTVRAWKESGPRLVILDNLEDMSLAAEVLARLRHSAIRILVTTRQHEWAGLNLKEIPLPVFTEEESLAFLRNYLPGNERASAEELIELHRRLGGLPLPLDLAGSYLKAVQTISVSDYLSQLRLDHRSLKNWRARYPNATQHDKDVAATFALSFERLENDEARDLFILAGYSLPNEPILLDVLFRASQLDKESFGGAYDLLQNLSLLQPEPSIHPLLSEYARLQDVDQDALFRWACALAWRCYPGYEHLGIYRGGADLARHARLCLPEMLQATSLPASDQKARSTLYYHLGFLYGHFGDLEGAMKMYQQSLEIDEGLGDLKGKSATLAMLGQVYVQKKAYPDALRALLESLQTLTAIGARPDAETVAGILVSFRKEIGIEVFTSAWKEISDSPIPDWLG